MFVYQCAKLCILEFYYDFLDKSNKTADFQWRELDTDSLYLALIVSKLDELVKLEMLKFIF